MSATGLSDGRPRAAVGRDRGRLPGGRAGAVALALAARPAMRRWPGRPVRATV
ncbi:hypothetical protein [Streptomyces sp. NPDC059783]|uniref:hypothetical protein n=1 Tax=Streptomyces sp. NPDC059783 TaxID=3346944 RepID=UPI00364B9A65